jgi:hypothetical protein
MTGSTAGGCVAVTGALGNLGIKLLRHLSVQDVFSGVVGVDLRPAPPEVAASLPKVPRWNGCRPTWPTGGTTAGERWWSGARGWCI